MTESANSVPAKNNKSISILHTLHQALIFLLDPSLSPIQSPNSIPPTATLRFKKFPLFFPIPIELQFQEEKWHHTRPMFGSRFSIFGTGGGADSVDKSAKSEVVPGLKLRSDKDVYRPGDPVVVTLEISSSVPQLDCSLLIDRLSFEIKGLQKLDAQWFSTQKPLHGSKQRRGSASNSFYNSFHPKAFVGFQFHVVLVLSGEHVFMDCSVQSVVSNQMVPAGSTKSCKPMCSMHCISVPQLLTIICPL